MTSPIHSANTNVAIQQKLAELRSKTEAANNGTLKPAGSTLATSSTSRLNELFNSDGANQGGKQLASYAGALGVDQEALLNAMKSGDPSKVTQLITSANALSAISGSSEEGSSIGGADASSATPNLASLYDSDSKGEDSSGGMPDVQSMMASLGRTGVQYDSKI